MLHYTFHRNQAVKALPQMLEGPLVTLQIVVLSMMIGLICAIALVLCRRSGN
jgi:hydroxyproline transport system permease protein